MNLSIYSFSLVPGSFFLTPKISIYTLPAGIVTGISGLDTQTMLVSRFQLYWPIGLVCMQLLTKEAFPAGSTVTTAAVVWNAPKAISFTPNTQNCYCLLSTNCFLWRTGQVKICISILYNVTRRWYHHRVRWIVFFLTFLPLVHGHPCFRSFIISLTGIPRVKLCSFVDCVFRLGRYGSSFVEDNPC